MFLPSLNNVVFPNERYQSLKGRLDQFEWKPAVDEEIIENDFWPKDEYLTEEDFCYGQRLFRRLEKRMVRKEDLTDEPQKLIRYFVPKGIIWIGSKK